VPDNSRLILKRASASRPSGEWNEDDFDVLADGAVVGRIMKAAAAPVPERLHLPLRPPAVEVAAAIPVKLQQFLSSFGVPGRR
jgi:hypothetical protein